MNTLKPVIDYSRMQFGDIITCTSDALISELIRSGEEFSEGKNVADILKAFPDGAVSSHSIMVYDVARHQGVEQTWPHPGLCNLDEYGVDGKGTHINGLYRCPWLDDGHNPESAAYLRDRVWLFVNTYYNDANIHGYALENLLAFLTEKFGIDIENRKGTVCSMFTTLALIRGVFDEGYDLRFPDGWIVAGEENAATVGLVSPLMQDQVFNTLGWAIPFRKYVAA
jgi:hypothetical protein